LWQGIPSEGSHPSIRCKAGAPGANEPGREAMSMTGAFPIRPRPLPPILRGMAWRCSDRSGACSFPALSGFTFHPFSDIAIHHMHDGRASDLFQAIVAHDSLGSEAGQVIDRFLNNLRDSEQQDILNPCVPCRSHLDLASLVKSRLQRAGGNDAEALLPPYAFSEGRASDHLRPAGGLTRRRASIFHSNRAYPRKRRQWRYSAIFAARAGEIKWVWLLWNDASGGGI
jgi:hypothetical protein